MVLTDDDAPDMSGVTKLSELWRALLIDQELEGRTLSNNLALRVLPFEG